MHVDTHTCKLHAMSRSVGVAKLSVAQGYILLQVCNWRWIQSRKPDPRKLVYEGQACETRDGLWITVSYVK